MMVKKYFDSNDNDILLWREPGNVIFSRRYE